MKKCKLIVIFETSMMFLLIIFAIFFTKYNLNANNTDKKSPYSEEEQKNLYKSFSALEIEQMSYSKFAFFSLTTDFAPSEFKKVKIGDNFTINYKLTNMTNKTIPVNIMGGQDSYEQIADLARTDNINPVATGDIKEYVFQPYETIILSSNIKVNTNSILYDNKYKICASVMVELLDDSVCNIYNYDDNITYFNPSYYEIKMDDMYILAE
ncbi:MAG: hypothetical protein ACI4SF_08810 [Oscillospiraceae bacterium]